MKICKTWYTKYMKKSECLNLGRDVYSINALLELEHAIDFATKKHEGQKRKSGEPYIIHPLHVAASLIDWGMDIDTVLAGVLHDTVEDTDATLEEIGNLFGEDVAFLVDGVTKVSQSRAGMRDLKSYLPATKDNLSKLLIAVGQDVRVIIIKLADRLHNMQTLQHMSREKQKKIARETLEIFAPLADRLNMGRVRVLLEELSFKYLSPSEYERTNALLRNRLRKSNRKLQRVRTNTSDALAKEKIEFEMDGRIKSVYSLYKKLDRIGDIDAIYDLIALRVVVKDIDTCYLVLDVLHRLYTPAYERIKDYITKPKKNGYQSLHTTVTTSTGYHVEFQIRTYEMHEYAERGLAASFHYNEQKLTAAYRTGNVQSLPEHLGWIKELQTAAQAAKAGKDFDATKFRMNLFTDRIFVYSPDGDIYDLPKGSFPLDYAYRIHSDLGSKASGFLVNGTMRPFTWQLSHGDTIEVKTSKTAQPKTSWLDMVATPYATEKIRAQLRKQGAILRFTQAASIVRKKTTGRAHDKTSDN